MKTPTVVLVAALSVSSTTLVAALADERETVVSYDDLELSRAADRAELVSRVRAAAVHVCGPASSARVRPYFHKYVHPEQFDPMAIKTCARHAMDRAIASLPAEIAREFKPHEMRETGLR